MKNDDFNSFGYRFHIQKSGVEFHIRIGLDWDYGQTHKYIPLCRTAFADYAPITKFIYSNAIDAMTELAMLKDWMRNMFKARPKSKEFLRQ